MNDPNNPQNIKIGDFVTNHYKKYNQVIYRVTGIDLSNKWKTVATMIPVINPDGSIVTKPTNWVRRTCAVDYLKLQTPQSITEVYRQRIDSLTQLQGI